MSIVLTSRSGPDSKLHLEIPVSEPDTEFEVEVVVRPKVPEGQGLAARLLRPVRFHRRRHVCSAPTGGNDSSRGAGMTYLLDWNA
jgi:hypothetical protein